MYTRFSHFGIEFLRENETVRETVLACSCWAQVGGFMYIVEQKIEDKNLVTLTLYPNMEHFVHRNKNTKSTQKTNFPF